MTMKHAIVLTALLLATACAGFPPKADAPSDRSLSSTSYESGYGIRPKGPQSVGDSQMDWGL